MEFTTISQARKETGLAYLGNINSSAKMKKNKKVSGQYTYILYLAPAKQSGFNVCSHSTPECRLGCLATSGHAGMELLSGGTRIKNSRIKKSRMFYENPAYFMAWMIAEIQYYQRKAEKDGYGFSIRLNGTSDIDWANVKINGENIFEIFPDVQFYDYTKNPNKFFNKPANYHLTFSYTGRNWGACEAVLEHGGSIAVVFNVQKKNPLPSTFKGYTVLNGDLTDYRPADKKGSVIGLYWKHIGDKDIEAQILNSCFVVAANAPECTYANVQEMEKVVM
jgi:hypothetical protein